MKIGQKIVCFSDPHFGLRNNEVRHNQEMLDFLEWMFIEAQEFGATTSICLGDWHHHRPTVQSRTLSFSNKAFEMLSENMDKHYQIVGNHDLFYKHSREVHSVEFSKNFSNIQVINEITTIGDTLLCPWLIEGEHQQVTKTTRPYVFGHFEFPSFLMNAMIAMPDLGEGHIRADDFSVSNQQVFSGHFHKRQTRRNTFGADITYLGNCFPHSFSDEGDDDRGIMLLELGKPPIYKKWPNAPRFRNILLSQLIENPTEYLNPLTVTKVTVDLDISYEEACFVKDSLTEEYGTRELKLVPNKQSITSSSSQEPTTFVSVGQMVTQELETIESKTIDNKLLLKIYGNL